MRPSLKLKAKNAGTYNDFYSGKPANDTSIEVNNTTTFLNDITLPQATPGSPMPTQSRHGSIIIHHAERRPTVQQHSNIIHSYKERKRQEQIFGIDVFNKSQENISQSGDFHTGNTPRDIVALQSGERKTCIDQFVISKENRLKGIFDIVMMVLSCYNTFANAYYAAFGLPANLAQVTWDYSIEFFFALDIIFSCLTEYIDEETFVNIRQVKLITIKYIKGSFFFDLLAWIPFDLILTNQVESQYLRLVKLLRLPRLIELLNVDRFKDIVGVVIEKRMKRVTKTNDTQEYNILTTLFVVYVYRIVRLVLVIFTSSYFLGIIWLIFVRDWTILEARVDQKLGNFYETYSLGEKSHLDQLILVWYFAITTLASVGYGDFSPQNTQERFIASFILLIGVAIFSFIMGNFIDILWNYKRLDMSSQDAKDLSKWLALVSRFNNGRPLKKTLIQKIEDHFEYYWNNDKLAAFKTQEDIRFLDELPKNSRKHIYLNYLFKDFRYYFRTYFQFPIFPNTRVFMQETDPKIESFMMALVQHLEPRRYSERDIIQEQHAEVMEMVFILQGRVAIGYRMFNETFYGKIIESKSVINDYAIIFNRCSEFLYLSVDVVEGFGFRKQFIHKLLYGDVGKAYKSKVRYMYKGIIKEPLIDHRREQSYKFQNRVDYVDLRAFGVIDGEYSMTDEEEKKEESMKIQEGEDSFMVVDQQAQICRRLKQVKGDISYAEKSVSCLASRQQEMMEMIFEDGKEDELQKRINQQVRDQNRKKTK